MLLLYVLYVIHFLLPDVQVICLFSIISCSRSGGFLHGIVGDVGNLFPVSSFENGLPIKFVPTMFFYLVAVLLTRCHFLRAGVMALCATSSYYDATEIATRILPNVVVLTIDPDRLYTTTP